MECSVLFCFRRSYLQTMAGKVWSSNILWIDCDPFFIAVRMSVVDSYCPDMDSWPPQLSFLKVMICSRVYIHVLEFCDCLQSMVWVHKSTTAGEVDKIEQIYSSSSFIYKGPQSTCRSFWRLYLFGEMYSHIRWNTRNNQTQALSPESVRQVQEEK